MSLEFSHIIEFVLVQVVAFIIFIFLKILLYFLLERVFGYNIPVIYYREEFLNFFPPCFLKIPSFFLKIFDGILQMVKNTRTRSFNLPEATFVQEAFRYPIEKLFKIASSQAYSSISVTFQAESLPCEDNFCISTTDQSGNLLHENSFSNSDGDHSQCIPAPEYNFNNSNFFPSCTLKIPSFFLKVFEGTHLVQSTRTRSSNLPQVTSWEETFIHPTENQLKIVSYQANSSISITDQAGSLACEDSSCISTIDQSENLPYENNFSNPAGGHSQCIPPMYSYNFSNGNQSPNMSSEDGSGDHSQNISCQVDFTLPTEDQLPNMPNQDVSTNTTTNQHVSLDANIYNVHESDIKPHSNNEILTNQKSEVRRRKKLSSTQQISPEIAVLRNLGKFYRIT